jgi:large subunit ribosomal protein L5
MKRFKEKYSSEIVGSLLAKYKNINRVPKIKKIVLNMGVGDAALNSKAIETAISDLTLISGQIPAVNKAKKSIAGFKIRQDMKIGCKVTLRKDRMYDFLERLVFVALPRIKQFRGLSTKSFDGRGNFNFGIRELMIFPEINYDKVESVRGMNITIVTTAEKDNDAKELLSLFDIPFYN